MTPIPKQEPQISPHIHQKMRKGCRYDYIEAFGAVYLTKKAVLKKSPPPFRRTRVKGILVYWYRTQTWVEVFSSGLLPGSLSFQQ